MGRRSLSGGVRPAGSDRIEFTFMYQGKRYRPTLQRVPSEANLRRARRQLADIKRRIRDGTFDFKEDFPDYRFTEQLSDLSKGREPAQEAKAPLQQQLMLQTWRPKLGAREFKSVVYSELVKIATSQGCKTKKTYNNGISPLRCAFAFGYKDHPEKPNPAEGLDSFRITKKDRPKIDPFTIHEAESLIRGLHVEWGEPIGNYDEFRFFTGLRQSEEIALRTLDCNLEKATIEIRHVIVLAREKDRTKTKEDRTVELCPRALSVLKRQFALREQWRIASESLPQRLALAPDEY